MKKRNITLFTAFAAAAAFASSAQAAVTLSDGHTGDYRIIFVTLDTTLAQATTIDFYNSFVTTQAGLNESTETKDLATTWKAVGSTKLTSARVNTATVGAGTGIHIYTPQGSGNYQLVATSYNDLWDGTIATGTHWGDGTEAGNGSSVQIQQWTGSNADGSSRAAGANGSYLGSGPNGDNTASYMHQVRGGYTDGNWISGPSDHDLQSKYMMGMSGVIPEPSTMGLLALSGLALLRRRRA